MGDRCRRYALSLAMLAIIALLLLLAERASRDRARAQDHDEDTAQYEPGHSQPHPELCLRRGWRLRLFVLVASALAHAAERRVAWLSWARGARGPRSGLRAGRVTGERARQAGG